MIMKHHTNYSLLLAAALTLGTATACSDFLEVDHYDILEEDYIIQSEANVLAGLNGLYDTFYTDQASGIGDDATWGFKPQIFAACHSTMDCQASGWDAEWQRHAWKADKGSLETAWRMSYRAIDRTNRYLATLANADEGIFENPANREIYEAEARAIRGYNYLYLAKLFGRVPLLLTGETYSSSPSKPRAETIEEVYAIIEEDLAYGRDHLDWTPLNGQYGRITRGFCKAFLAELYMWEGNFENAKKELKDIIDSGTYELDPCYGNLHNWDVHWTMGRQRFVRRHAVVRLDVCFARIPGLGFHVPLLGVVQQL